MYKELIQKLNKIAEKNDDEFCYRIDIDYSSTRNVISFNFVVEETADHHVFLETKGGTPEAAAQNALVEISNACESWGYEEI